jgi:hypothetical protein
MFLVCRYLEVPVSVAARTRLVTNPCFRHRQMVSRLTHIRSVRVAQVLLEFQWPSFRTNNHRPGDMVFLHQICMAPRRILYSPARRCPTRWVDLLDTTGHRPGMPTVNSSRPPLQDHLSRRQHPTRDLTVQTCLSFTFRIILRIWICINFLVPTETC